MPTAWGIRHHEIERLANAGAAAGLVMSQVHVCGSSQLRQARQCLHVIGAVEPAIGPVEFCGLRATRLDLAADGFIIRGRCYPSRKYRVAGIQPVGQHLIGVPSGMVIAGRALMCALAARAQPGQIGREPRTPDTVSWIM